ncbi:hypothetical protein M758_8G028900 [Ceratodon purpureus]|nr:hypothetical protein M758_8G028900 [Ceratodon purpureus]
MVLYSFWLQIDSLLSYHHFASMGKHLMTSQTSYLYTSESMADEPVIHVLVTLDLQLCHCQHEETHPNYVTIAYTLNPKPQTKHSIRIVCFQQLNTPNIICTRFLSN